MEIVNWSRSRPALTLLENEVHIWRAWLDVDVLERARLSQLLSKDESVRAERFVFPRDRDHFVVARGRLRELLGLYLLCKPDNLKFSTGTYGKPSLKDRSELHFNVAHSHSLAVYGFSMHRKLGIDVEKIQPEFAGEEIAERYFSIAEQRELREVPAELRATAFFLCWTRKEAYVKAHGDGLQMPLDSFDVSLTPGKPETLRSPDSDRWSLHSFLPAPEYAAAIIVEAKFESMHFYDDGASPDFSKPPGN